MWVGFAVKHAGRKLAVGASVTVAAVLATDSGRRVAKVLTKGVRAGSEAALEELKAQRLSKRVHQPSI